MKKILIIAQLVWGALTIYVALPTPVQPYSGGYGHSGGGGHGDFSGLILPVMMIIQLLLLICAWCVALKERGLEWLKIGIYLFLGCCLTLKIGAFLAIFDQFIPNSIKVSLRHAPLYLILVYSSGIAVLIYSKQLFPKTAKSFNKMCLGAFFVCCGLQLFLSWF